MPAKLKSVQINSSSVRTFKLQLVLKVSTIIKARFLSHVI